MTVSNPMGDAPKHFLQPCTIFAHREEYWISTILGSCIAVCLWDSQLGLGGMNHYMLPLWNGEGLPTPKYGNIAIERLVKRMQSLGAREDRLVAKVFGGSQVIAADQFPFSIGERNATLARELLGERGIQVAAASVGGELGRKIHFNTRTGSVYMAHLTGAPEPSKGMP